MRQADCESRAAAMSWMDEKQRLLASLQSVEGQLAVLEDAKEKEKATQRPARGLYKKNLDDDSSNSSDSVVMVMTEEEVRAAKYRHSRLECYFNAISSSSTPLQAYMTRTYHY